MKLSLIGMHWFKYNMYTDYNVSCVLKYHGTYSFYFGYQSMYKERICGLRKL